MPSFKTWRNIPKDLWRHSWINRLKKFLKIFLQNYEKESSDKFIKNIRGNSSGIQKRTITGENIRRNSFLIPKEYLDFFEQFFWGVYEAFRRLNFNGIPGNIEKRRGCGAVLKEFSWSNFWSYFWSNFWRNFCRNSSCNSCKNS